MSKTLRIYGQMLLKKVNTSREDNAKMFHYISLKDKVGAEVGKK